MNIVKIGMIRIRNLGSSLLEIGDPVRTPTGVRNLIINKGNGANKMIRVVCKGKLKPGVNVEEYLIFAREVVTETRKEKGCIMYTLHADINDPSIITTIEEWENEEDINQHNKSEHVVKIVPKLRKLRESTEINHYKEV
jgi:quinol monooxygenase YgiN